MLEGRREDDVIMSPAGLPDIDFAQIRPHGQPASRDGAFEELASILIEQGVVDWPGGVRFERFGNPDGGREGQGVLPGGDVWAWQVKYIFAFDQSAVTQVTSSVTRVLGQEPRLKRYFVVIPIDLPAGDTDGKPGGRKLTSAHTRWAEGVETWEKAARAKGMDVDFVLVDAHQLLTALTEPRHAGRARYWFGVNVLSPQWQQNRIEEAKDDRAPGILRALTSRSMLAVPLTRSAGSAPMCTGGSRYWLISALPVAGRGGPRNSPRLTSTQRFRAAPRRSTRRTPS